MMTSLFYSINIFICLVLSCWFHLIPVFGSDQRQAFCKNPSERYLTGTFPFTDAKASLNKQPLRGNIEIVLKASLPWKVLYVVNLSSSILGQLFLWSVEQCAQSWLSKCSLFKEVFRFLLIISNDSYMNLLSPLYSLLPESCFWSLIKFLQAFSGVNLIKKLKPFKISVSI